MKYDILLLNVLFILFCGCSSKQNNIQESFTLESISIVDFETMEGRLSDFVEEVKMIPLEFTDKSILGEIKKVVLSDKFIFIMERSNKAGVYVFDRAGKFFCRVGSRGQGPEDFVNLSDFSISEEDKLIYLFDEPRTRVLAFTFDNKFVKAIQVNNYASCFEYQNGLFYLYRESASSGDPLCSLVIKDQDGKLVKAYYPILHESMYISSCVFRKTENNILFAQDMVDSVFILSRSELNPKYYIDYKDKTMRKDDREDIKNQVRPPVTIMLEKKTIGGIKDIFEVNNKVFIENVNVIVPMLTVYDKTKKEVKTFQYIFDDLMFLATEYPIGQYKEYLLSVKEPRSIQHSMNYFDVLVKEGRMDEKKAVEIRKMIEEKIPDRESGDSNPVLFMLKVKK